MHTIRDAIERHAGARPDAPFVLAPEPGTTITYAQFRVLSRGLSAELAARGIQPGEVVSYMLPNGVSAATVFLGAMHGGYVASPVSLLAQDSQIEYTLAHSATRIVFAAPEFVARLQALVQRSGSRAVVRPTSPDDPGLHGSARASAEGAVPEATAPALLMYTSGTTGVPKGALLSHANLIHAGLAVAASLALTPADRVLSSLPLYHINGQCVATVSPLVSGGSVVMPHRFSVDRKSVV